MFDSKCSLVVASESIAPANLAFALNVVPSDFVPNLLPNIVENKVLRTCKNGISSTPETAPLTGVLILASNLLAMLTCPVK